MSSRKNKNRQPSIKDDEEIGGKISGEIIFIINIMRFIFTGFNLFISDLSTIGVQDLIILF